MAAGALGVVFIVAFIALAYYFVMVGVRRREAFARVAASLGWQYSADDPLGCTDLPFALLHMGDDQSAGNVLWGQTTDGRPARLFDFEYEEESIEVNNVSTTDTYRFSCAVIDIGAACPHMRLDHESFLGGLRDAFGFRDQQFESEEFNRAWKVSCDDGRFAQAFVDPRMMAFLLDRGADVRYEVNGSQLLVATDRLEPDQVPSLLAHSNDMRATIPRVVWELYPGGAR